MIHLVSLRIIAINSNLVIHKEKKMNSEKKEKNEKTEMLKVVKKGHRKSSKSTIIEACTSRTR